MKYVRQLLIILFVSFFGELLKYIIPLSIPASIYGMVLLFLALELKIDDKSDQAGAGQDRGGFSDRDHAIDVCAGRSRTS